MMLQIRVYMNRTTYEPNPEDDDVLQEEDDGHMTGAETDIGAIGKVDFVA